MAITAERLRRYLRAPARLRGGLRAILLDKESGDYVSDRTLLRAIEGTQHESLFVSSPMRTLRLRVELSTRRSSKWRPTRCKHLREHPRCVICGETRPRLLAVHHYKPFCDFPELELDPDNLRTLCEGVINDHFLFGHLRNWKHSNPQLDDDAAIWTAKLTLPRPDDQRVRS